ncbi:GNAT family N-acetyltransferase [Alkalibacterium sp.]|nr:MAG: GNAT family N-acetyltransferase [Alkalibacterium sp.]
MEYIFAHLPKDKWKGKILPIAYTTNDYYDISVDKTEKGYDIKLEKKNFSEPVHHSSHEDEDSDRLYADYLDHAYAWGLESEGELVAAIETAPEVWSNRLRITELWVADSFQKKGIGHALIEIAKEQARHERRRGVVLETQSCNVNAIEFYQHEGFELIGLDVCSYSNTDIENKEVRLEFGWLLDKRPKVTGKEVEIRSETPEDFYAVELMTQHAFWNKYQPGCDEHYLVHQLREHDDYLPELSRIAVIDDEVVGCIMYTKAKVTGGNGSHEVLTFGPLCVHPKWQGCGIGELLLKETMILGRNQGYKGIIIFGEPDYYPRLGFQTCDTFDITTASGKNFEAFMGIELITDGFKNIEGKYYSSDIFENLPSEAVEQFNKNFPPLRKLTFPGQIF